LQEDAHELVRSCGELGPLGGVFHLAMVLRDCLFENQNVQNFKDAAEAKYFGTMNLDEATRGCDLVRWFVVFSSITSGRGNAGQTNYGWSNSTMERIIEQRRHDGYPGIAIQWGAIGDVGVILENMGDNNTVVGGTLPQRMPSCLATLDLFLSWDHPIVSRHALPISHNLHNSFHSLCSYIKADTSGKKQSTGGNLLQTIAHILGVNDISQLNPDANLGDLGLDSLMGVEIKQALERDYDITLSMKEIRTLTLNKLMKMAECGGGSALQGDGELELRRDGEQLARENTVQVLEQQMGALFKLRVDVNDLDPEQILVRCNEAQEGPVTFFVRPFLHLSPFLITCPTSGPPHRGHRLAAVPCGLQVPVPGLLLPVHSPGAQRQHRKRGQHVHQGDEEGAAEGALPDHWLLLRGVHRLRDGHPAAAERRQRQRGEADPAGWVPSLHANIQKCSFG
jgi:acyl carrier protein